jgi:hypothetical protein
MAYDFNARATGETDDDVIMALELIIKQIQDGYTSGQDSGENRDYYWSLRTTT